MRRYAGLLSFPYAFLTLILCLGTRDDTILQRSRYRSYPLGTFEWWWPSPLIWRNECKKGLEARHKDVLRSWQNDHIPRWRNCKEKGVVCEPGCASMDWQEISSPIVGLSSVRALLFSSLVIVIVDLNLQVERLEASVMTGKELTEEESRYLEEPWVYRWWNVRHILMHHIDSYEPKNVRGHE